MRKALIIGILTTLIVGLVYFGFNFFQIKSAKAGSGDNLSGYAWSENIGWISFNSTNCDTDGDGKSNGAPGCPSVGISIVNYGVNVANDGKLSGWAWSENIGWITFDKDKLIGCPSGPCEAKLDRNTGAVSGWARACAGTVNGDCNSVSRSDGWDGWIRLQGNNYGVSSRGVGINGSCPWQGWVWGSDVVGWISFAGSSYGVVGKGSACVETNNPPSANGLLAKPQDYCTSGTATIFSWTFSDIDPGDKQSAYRVQIDNDKDFSSPEHDSGIVTSSSNFYSTFLASYNTTYYWRLKVWDSNYPERESDWIQDESQNITTPSHAYPDAEFSYSPISEIIPEDQKVTFTALGGCSTANCEFEWSFQGGSPNSFTQSVTDKSQEVDPVDVTFKKIENGNTVILKVTDADGNSCENTKKINVSKWPIWIEIPPSAR